MKSIKIAALSLIMWSMPVFAQHQTSSFQDYATLLNKHLDISMKCPEGFKTDDKFCTLFNFTLINLNDKKELSLEESRQYAVPYVCSYQFETEDQQCAIMYPEVSTIPMLFQWMEEKTWAEKMETYMRQELCSALYMKYKEVKDTAKYITTYTGAEANRLFGADIVFLVDFPLHKAYEDKYTACTGLYIYKAGHLPVCMKYFFTDKAAPQRDSYLKKGAQAIRFGSSANSYNVDSFQDAFYKNKA